ncbi:MAG TPA: YggT family protein [Bacillales bacterium]|nr:YggT family protein [Bacillales bacterium]
MYYVLSLILWLIHIYSWVLIIYILMSWFPNARDTTFGRFMASLAEPFLEPFRRIIPPLGMIDFSPIVALLVLRLFVPKGIVYLFHLFM